MNRRSAIKAAIAGVAAAIGWKVASPKWRRCVPGPITTDGKTFSRKPIYVDGYGCPPPRGVVTIIENEHGTFVCTVTADGTTWRAV